MALRAAGGPAGKWRASGDARIVCQVVAGIWIYSLACGAIAVGVGQLAVAVAGTQASSLWIRVGATSATVVAAGVCADKVLTRLASRR